MKFNVKNLFAGKYGTKFDLELPNSIYGMMAQDPLKDKILYVGGGEPYRAEGKPNEELLEKYRLAGDGAVYCDTDSVKYVDEVDWEI